MAGNQKLSALLAGRIVDGSEAGSGTLNIRFRDGSQMTVNTGDGLESLTGVEGAQVTKVQQDTERLTLDFGGASWVIPTAEPTSSVLLRNSDGELEYAD